MMTNVIDFPEPKSRKRRTYCASRGPVTLFIHVKRATMIAHLTGRFGEATTRDDRVGKR